MRFFKFLPLLFLSAFILTSCGDDGPQENSQTLIIQSSLNYVSVIDRTDNTQSVLPGADYGIVVNLDRSTLQLSINNFQFAASERAISFTLPEIRMDYTQTGWEINSNDPISVDTGNGSAVISNLRLKFVLRSDGSQNLVTINFVLDNRYEVTTIFTHNQFIGETKSTDITDPENNPFSTNQSRYLVILDGKTKKAEVQIAYPKFLEGMPSNLGVMRFKDIPVTSTKDGFTFATGSLIPEISNVPYPAFAITNLSGTVVAGKTLSLTFECEKYNRKVTVAGTAY